MQPTNKPFLAMLTLLQAGLWERRPKDCSLFPLTPAEWTAVFVLAQQQTVLGITYRGLDYLPEYLFPPQELLIRWVAEIGRIEERNLESNQSLIELLELFEGADLYPILQKGQGVATLYDRPLLRTCGDIDLWFPSRREGHKALQLIIEKGCTPEKAPDGSYHYHWRGIEVEHHPSLIDLQSVGVKGWARRQVKAMEPVKVTLPEHPETPILTPSSEINLLLLNAHICKHAIGLGIGLRQMCDMARAYYALHTSVDGEAIRKLYKRAGLERWSNLLHRFLVDYLGLDKEWLPYEEQTTESAEPLMKVVLRGGNFGQFAAERQAAMQGKWQRKRNTAKSFLRNCRFSFRYARHEALWTVWQLLKGQA